MGSYTITFTPDDVTNASAVVRVDLGTSGARITELTVRAGSGDGLVPGELPGFDLGRLMRAIAPAGPTAPAFELSATPSAVAAEASYTTTEPAPARKAAKRATAGRGATGRGAAGRSAPAKQAATKQAGAKKTAKAAPGTGRGARAASGTAAGSRSGGGGRPTARSSGAAAARTGTSRTATSRGATGRAYRRTPDDIVEVFTQAPSATALARHYGVPRHTVQGWLRRLRSEGVLPPSSRAA